MRRLLQYAAAVWLMSLSMPACAQYDVSQPVSSNVNDFPVSINAVAFCGEVEEVTATFRVFFTTGEDKYLPVREEIAQMLSVEPIVDADSRLNVKITSMICRPKELTVSVGDTTAQGQGGEIECAFTVEPDRSLAEGIYRVHLGFKRIDEIAHVVKATQPICPAAVEADVRVWSSHESQQSAMRAESQRRRQQEAAAERARKAKTAERRRRAIRSALVWLTIIAGVAVCVTLRCRTLTVRLPAGDFAQIPDVVKIGHRWPAADAGTIVSTNWARSWPGTKRRIKVEVLVMRDNQAADGSDPHVPARLADLLVSAGASVRPGTYIVRIPRYLVRVKVLTAQS